jgi:hypothetical protein
MIELDHVFCFVARRGPRADAIADRGRRRAGSVGLAWALAARPRLTVKVAGHRSC